MQHTSIIQIYNIRLLACLIKMVPSHAVAIIVIDVGSHSYILKRTGRVFKLCLLPALSETHKSQLESSKGLMAP